MIPPDGLRCTKAGFGKLGHIAGTSPQSDAIGRDHAGLAVWGCTLVVAIAGMVVVGLPLLGVMIDSPGRVDPAIRGAARPDGWPVWLSTVCYPVAIAGLAVLMAWPSARLLRTAGWLTASALLMPLVLPSFLAYSGWSMVAGPTTALGDLVGAAAPWVGVAVSRGMAVIGLALWATPIAAVVIASGLRSVPQAQVDALALAGRRSGFARQWQEARLAGGHIAAAFASVGMLMLSSAVPLHLAQVPTLAIAVWSDLSLGASVREAWVTAWPLVAAAAVAAVGTVRSLAHAPPAAALDQAPSPLRLHARLAAWAVWAAAAALPVGLFAWGIRGGMVESISRFWAMSGTEFVFALQCALWAAIGTIALAAAAWCALSCARPAPGWVRATIGLTTVAWMVMGLVPGVLAGAAIRSWWNQPVVASVGDALDRSGALLHLAHCARFGWLGLAAAWVLARRESPALADVRRLHGAMRGRDWLRLVAPTPGGAALVLGAGAAAGALSLHEIEATVILAPPGARVLSQQILEHLHYNYVQEMCAAAVSLSGVCFVLATLTGLMWVKWQRSGGVRAA